MEISIRKFRESDAEEFHAAVLESVEHVSEWLPWCTPAYSLQNAQEWFDSAGTEWEAGTDYRFLIEDCETKGILGTVGINQIVHQHKIGNMGYWVRKFATNKGVCTKAARLVEKICFC